LDEPETGILPEVRPGCKGEDICDEFAEETGC
jgi:hypothetical protein